MNSILKITDGVLSKNGTHKLTKPKPLVPFSSQHPATYLKGNFKVIISELGRNITNFKLNKEELFHLARYYEDANIISEYVANSKQLDFEDDTARVNFIRFIDAHLFDQDNQMKIIHTYLYNFIGESEPNQTTIRSIAEFIASVLIGENEDLQNIFKNKETDDLLTKLIIEEIDHLVSGENSKNKAVYANMLPQFVELFQTDLRFMMKHPDFFVANFEVFVNYYVFMYHCQMVLHFEKLLQGSEEINPLYFALDWESVTKKRGAAGYSNSYKFIRQYASNLFVHEFVLRLLSHNMFNEHVEKNLEVYSYKTLVSKVESHGEEYIQTFVKELQQLIHTYAEWAGLSVENTLSNDLEQLFSELLALVKKKVSPTVAHRYGMAIEYLAQGVFLKQRGNLGYLLNMQHDFLMLMTALIVKDERMPFKVLVQEFEKRGIAFDRHSIEEIITLFNNHNILDKKSDSGDAQYVKPIL